MCGASTLHPVVCRAGAGHGSLSACFICSHAAHYSAGLAGFSLSQPDAAHCAARSAHIVWPGERPETLCQQACMQAVLVHHIAVPCCRLSVMLSCRHLLQQSCMSSWTSAAVLRSPSEPGGWHHTVFIPLDEMMAQMAAPGIFVYLYHASLRATICPAFSCGLGPFMQPPGRHLVVQAFIGCRL